MRPALLVLLLAAACAGSAPPVKPGGPSDPGAPEGPLSRASPELDPDAGIGRYEQGSTPSMANMEMGGMQHGGSTDAGMSHDMRGMTMDGGMR